MTALHGRWDDDAVAALTKYWNEGYSARQIADALGDGISRCAVIGKAHRLGLASREEGVNPLRQEASAERKAEVRFHRLPQRPHSRKEYAKSRTVAVSRPHWEFKLIERPPEMTKSQLRAELAQAVRNTAAMPVE